MDTININNFTTSPIVREYLLAENTHPSIGSRYKMRELNDQLSSILQKKENGEKLSAIELERDFQFQRFFTWKQESSYQVVVNLSGSFYSEHTLDIGKDLFDEISEGDSDYNYSDLCVDPYDLDDPRDGVEIEHSEVGSKHFYISVSDLKIKDEFKNIAPDAGTMIEGGAA
tara:strand:+ start:31 stop:543 length:513 start_codon:yes stop_codon:yes gene_type:complete